MSGNPKGELSVVDWILCIVCSLIGCIVGIVALIQGDSKRGGIMIGVSIGAAIFWNVLAFVAQMALAPK